MPIRHINKEIAVNCAIQIRHYQAEYSATGNYGNIEAAGRYEQILHDHGLKVEDVEDESSHFAQATA